MSRLQVELKVRALRAQIGERLRRGAPVVAALKRAVAELEAQTRRRDLDFLRARLSAMLKDWQFNLLLRANPWLILQKGFFRHSAHVVAPHLLSKIIVMADGRAGRIAEVRVKESSFAHDIQPRSDHRAGRLVLNDELVQQEASVTCIDHGQPSMVVIQAIKPVEGAAVMEAQAGAPPDKHGLFRGSRVVASLGLASRHQGTDVTRRQSPIRIAWDFQAPPLVLGQARRSRKSRTARIWSWGVPRR